MTPGLLNAEQAAALLGLTDKQGRPDRMKVYQNPDIPRCWVSKRRVRFDPEELLQYAKRHRRPGPEREVVHRRKLYE